MKEKKSKLPIIILIVVVVSFAVYAIFIASPKEIINNFLNRDDPTRLIADNDNINGVYVYSEPLDGYHAIYTGCRINSIDYYVVVINDNYFTYRSSCIATYLLDKGKIDDIKIEYSELNKVFELYYKNKKYTKNNTISQVVPNENVLKNLSSLYIESLSIVLKQIEFENHYPNLTLNQLYNFKEFYGLVFTPGESNFSIRITTFSGDTIAEYVFNDLDHIPSFYNFNRGLGVLINNSTDSKYNYEIQLINKTDIIYRLSSNFPITVDDISLNTEDYNVYITKELAQPTFHVYLSKYHDFCIPDDDSNTITYYEFKVTYNYSIETFNKPEYVGKGYAKEGCGKIVPIEEE